MNRIREWWKRAVWCWQFRWFHFSMNTLPKIKLLFTRLYWWHLFEFGWIGQKRRSVWNRGILLWWNRFWIRINEFDRSLDIDIDAVREMTPEQHQTYMNDLCKRRKEAHERDLIRSGDLPIKSPVD